MEIMSFLGGAILGLLVSIILETRKTHGIIEVDHDTKQCKIHMISEDLLSRKTKKAIFVIDHDAAISREEQIL